MRIVPYVITLTPVWLHRVASLGGGPSEAGLDWLRERSQGHKMSVLYDAGLYVRVDSPRFEGLSVLRSKLCVV